MNDKQITVATPSEAVMAMAADIELTRDLMGGTQAMRKAGAKHLPAWPNEDALTYKTRLNVSTLFPAYSRTVTTLTGKPFSKPITYSEDVPEQLKEWMDDDSDLQGRNLDTFAACSLQSALAYGLSGILVDAPTVIREVEGNKPITQAEEQAMGVRPYLIHIEPWNILGWRTERINGVQTLVQLRLREFVTVNDGEFSDKTVEQVRVLTRGGWAIHRKSEDGNWSVFQSGVTSIKEIPFVPVYGMRTDFMQAKPPMLEMAHLNVKHWQSQSDQDNILHVSRVPILVVSGVDDDAFSMTIGASAAVKLPTGATAVFVEHSGVALGAGRISLEDLKEEMRQAGAELLVIQQAQITATQVNTESSVGMCALQRIVQSTEDALDMALQFCAEFMNLPEGGNVTIFNDFAAANMNEASAQLLFSMRQAGDLSKETLLKEVQRRGILAADVDVEEELDKAQADGPELGTIGAGNGNA